MRAAFPTTARDWARDEYEEQSFTASAALPAALDRFPRAGVHCALRRSGSRQPECAPPASRVSQCHFDAVGPVLGASEMLFTRRRALRARRATTGPLGPGPTQLGPIVRRPPRGARRQLGRSYAAIPRGSGFTAASDALAARARDPGTASWTLASADPACSFGKQHNETAVVGRVRRRKWQRHPAAGRTKARKTSG